MSTNYVPVPPVNEHDMKVSVMQYCGPEVEEGNRLRLQLTQGVQYLQLSRAQALVLAFSLQLWVNDMLQED